MTSIVALDLETTGLDPQTDAILEIGARRFDGNRVEDEFSTLINPGRHIPEFISGLTGISDEMVRQAPSIRDVLEGLVAFIGDSPILGHNIQFDLSFFKKYKLFELNERLDTYELAAVLLPSANRYNLGSLVQALGVALPATHRALDDARATHGVYQRLLAQAKELPPDLLAEIVRHSEPIEWAGSWAFQQALQARSHEGIKAKRVRSETAAGLSEPDAAEKRKGPPIQVPKEPLPIDAEEAASVLEHGGPFSRYFESYEHRPEQVEMLKAVANALSYGQHLMVEAGTGVGKCLTGDVWVTFEDGKRRQIGEIAQENTLPAEPILCVDQKGKLSYQKIRALHDNGIRPVWKLTTGLGHKIIATANHPFLTINGWRNLCELKTGDRTAVLRHLPTGNLSFPDHEAFIAGIMIGDGGCGRPDSLSFTNFDPEVVESCRQNVEKLGNVRMTNHKAKGSYGFRRLSLIGHERSGLNLLLEKLDILGRVASTKIIPGVYFLADQKTICHLLAGLWVTDGCIEQHTGNISISSASEQLITDVQHLLLRLGIISRVRYKSVHLKEKRFDSWRLSILDIQSKRLFGQTVGNCMVGKRKQQLDAWLEAHKYSKHSSNDDLFPLEIWDHINQARSEAGKSWYAIRRASTIASDHKREISREKLLSIGDFLSAPALIEMATTDLYWDRIVTIEPVGKAGTFDLTMDGEPNFVANDIVVHNSFAYLVPAALFALQNNTRVVISTNTINLQDQLIKKDIPDLCAALGLDLRAAVLKGRSNYLCPRRLELLRKRGPGNADEMRVLAKVLVWKLENSSGDRTEINLTGPAEREIWGHISAEDDACTSETCLERTGGACPFFRAKQASQNAHILVVNHALLLTDVAVGNRVLPDYDHVIIDEGHHLESATTDSLSFRLTQFDIDRLIRETGGSSSGILGNLLATTRDQIRPSDYALLNQKVERATDLVWRLQEQVRIFFDGVGEFISLQREGQPVSTYAYQERILPATRTQPGWDAVEVAWGAAAETLTLLVALLGEIQKGMTEIYSDGLESLEDIIGSLGNLYRRLTEAESMLGSMIFEPATDYVYWVEVNPNNNRLALNAAPIRVGPLVEKYLWHEKRSVILTSATLTTHGEFNYIRNTLTADEADELALGSPFDYETAALLYIANDIAEPNAREYQGQLDRALVALCTASGGGTLVLFTSYAQLKRSAKSISGPLAQQDILVYEQGEGASPNALLESFKSTERAVLLGTRSFWEGVDIPGEALSVLVIVKLPFAVPSDPLVAARAETFEDPFNEYHLPEAILRFRQGFGRLIRTQSDRGVVAILDRRVLTKAYGKQFIESLPSCTLKVGSLSELPRAAAKWLG
jgi:DNA polymerase-3 subunit epsilon/ATP-dependent DNA helicase DinG